MSEKSIRTSNRTMAPKRSRRRRQRLEQQLSFAWGSTPSTQTPLSGSESPHASTLGGGVSVAEASAISKATNESFNPVADRLDELADLSWMAIAYKNG